MADDVSAAAREAEANAKNAANEWKSRAGNAIEGAKEGFDKKPGDRNKR